jgi:DNA-binding LacI/PurR family transcriptional regulator
MALRDLHVTIPDDVRLYGIDYQNRVIERAALVLNAPIPTWSIPWNRIATVAARELLAAIRTPRRRPLARYIDLEARVFDPPLVANNAAESEEQS